MMSSCFIYHIISVQIGFHPPYSLLEKFRRRNAPARRGGLHNNQQRPQNMIPCNGAPSSIAISQPQMQNPVTLSQRSARVLPPRPSLQQQEVLDDEPEHDLTDSTPTAQQQVQESSELVLQQQDETEDPPSSGELPSAYWGPAHTPLFEDDPMDCEMEDPGTEGGRKTNKAPKAFKKKESRINITLDAHGVFVNKKVINKIIAHRMKYYFEPSYTSWGKVPKKHRELLWREIGKVCRWDPELQEHIARQWNAVHSSKYRDMMQKARKFAKKGKRPKWMQVRHYWKCVRYWKTPDFVKISRRNSENRGVLYNEAGNVVLGAKATHIGGSKSIYERGDSLMAFIETRFDSNKGKRPAVDGDSREDTADEFNEGEPMINNTEKCLSDKDQAIIDNYRKNLETLAPEDRPLDSEPRNPIAWGMAVGGAKRGRVPGVSTDVDPRLLGYATTKRQAHHNLNLENAIGGVNEKNNQKLKEQIRSEVMKEIQIEMEKTLQQQVQQQVQIAMARLQKQSNDQPREISGTGGEDRTEGNEDVTEE